MNEYQNISCDACRKALESLFGKNHDVLECISIPKTNGEIPINLEFDEKVKAQLRYSEDVELTKVQEFDNFAIYAVHQPAYVFQDF